MKVRYLLNTGMMGHFINHRRGVDVRVRDAHERGARIGTCMPVVGELFYGVEWSTTRDVNLKRLQRALSRIVCWPFDRQAAEEYGRLAAELRRIGRPMQQIDIQIAAIAVSVGNATVVTGDILRLLQYFLFAGMCCSQSEGRVDVLTRRGRPTLAAVA